MQGPTLQHKHVEMAQPSPWRIYVLEEEGMVHWSQTLHSFGWGNPSAQATLLLIEKTRERTSPSPEGSHRSNQGLFDHAGTGLLSTGGNISTALQVKHAVLDAGLHC